METPRAARSPEGQPPRTEHPAQLPTSCPRESPGWGARQTQSTAQLWAPVAARGASVFPACKLLPPTAVIGVGTEGAACANDRSLCCFMPMSGASREEPEQQLHAWVPILPGPRRLTHQKGKMEREMKILKADTRQTTCHQTSATKPRLLPGGGVGGSLSLGASTSHRWTRPRERLEVKVR